MVFSFLAELDLHLTKIYRSLQQLIQQYVLTYKKISIEGWGTLQLNFYPASVDFLNKRICPPVAHLIYSETSEQDNRFVNWLSQEMNISIAEAAESLKQFADVFKTTIAAKKIVWTGWGSFEYINNSISFTPSAGLSAQPIAANRVIRKGEEHNIRVGEEERTNTQMEEFLHDSPAKKKYAWWMGGLILLVFGIILAVLFAYKHNIQWKKYTNYHQLQPKEPPVLYKTP